MKTRAALFESVIACIKAVQTYSVPEIVATVFTAGFQGCHRLDRCCPPPTAIATARRRQILTGSSVRFDPQHTSD